MLDKERNKVTKAPSTPEMSDKAQNLIKDLFTFSHDSDEGSLALEGTISLAKFGQYKRALEEFDKLLSKDNFRVSAAKNIIKCYNEFVSLDRAVEEFLKWNCLLSPPCIIRHHI